MDISTVETTNENLVFMAYENSQGLDKSAQMCSLVRAYAACTNKVGTYLEAQTKIQNFSVAYACFKE